MRKERVHDKVQGPTRSCMALLALEMDNEGDAVEDQEEVSGSAVAFL